MTSMTSFTRASLRSDRVHLCLDLFHRHRLARLGADFANDLEEAALVAFQTQLARNEDRNLLGIKQGLRFGLGRDRLWQNQFNCDAHNASLAEGYRSELRGPFI